MLVLLAAVPAVAEPLFASPPHFLALAGHEQVVFFLNEPVVGAIASRTGTDTVEVVVPRAAVDATLRGTTFRANESDTTGTTTVALTAGARGNASIRITTSEAVTGVHAYSESDPPRLIVDLAAGAAQPTATSPAPRRTPAPGVATATAARVASPRPTSTPASATATAPPATATAGRATAFPRVSARPTAAAPSARPSPATKPLTKTDLRPLRSTVAVAAATDAEGATDTATDGPPVDRSASANDFPCAWRRVAGVAFCAPDPKALAYAIAPPLAALAGALADGNGKTPLPEAPAGDAAAPLYLHADRELVTRAPSGRLLPAIDAYRRALRRAPGFFDAPRARLNVALAYRALGFEAELRSMRDEPGSDALRPIVDGLVGDLARERGVLDRARAAYASADAGGGAGSCLAARGRAALALGADPPRDATAELSRLPDLCPPALLADVDTVRVQAREQVAAGDPRRALAMLDAVRPPGRATDGGLLDDVAAAAAAAGDATAARQAYTQLASGRFGARLAARGALGLARLDAAGGDVAAGFRRLSDLQPDAGTAERRRFALDALLAALKRGADQEAVTMVAEHGLPVATLALEDQIRLAHAYRAVGLTTVADALLRRLAGTLGPNVPDALWEERGAAALAGGSAPAALAVADEWLRARGTGGAALALRARALAALGQAAAAVDAATHAVATLDPLAARVLRVDLARRIRATDAALAGRLAREALADESIPALAAPEAAALLRLVAEGAEATGDDVAALAAYSVLSARYADQPSAAGATYRVARLTAGAGGGAAASAAYAEVARSKDVLERRVGTAAQTYEAIVRPFENRKDAP